MKRKILIEFQCKEKGIVVRVGKSEHQYLHITSLFAYVPFTAMPPEKHFSLLAIFQHFKKIYIMLN